MRVSKFAGCAAGAASLFGVANAQLLDYVTASGGYTMLQDSNNVGALNTPFTTGTGTTLPAGTIFPSGAPVGFDTDFSGGYALSAAAGRSFGPLRGEVEVAYQSNGVNSHSNLAIAGRGLDNEDASVLFPGGSPLGTAVGNVLAEDDGRIRTVFVMANAYWDVPVNLPVRPYIGAGVGAGFVDVNFKPSNVAVIDGNSVEFAWQLMGGAAYAVADRAEVFAGYRFRKTTDAGVKGALFDSTFDVENRAHILEVGLRWRL